jgi:beta-glucosidase
LKAFAPVAIPAGGTAVAELDMAVADLARWEPGRGWVVDPGRWRCAFAASAADLRLETAVDL